MQLTDDASRLPADEGSGLIACHVCDALLTEPPLAMARTRCPRCHTVLSSVREGSIDYALVSAMAGIIFIVSALWLPFITIEAAGRHRSATIIDAVIAAGGEARALAVAVGSLILALPLTRALALIWALAPIRLGRPPAPFAREMFRFTVEIRPWAMADVFVVGVVVALVKIAGLASVGLGAAFWLFVASGVFTVMEDASLCRRTVWRLLS